ncbi:neutral zinc metallopeptidase [Neobacillus cucumis]|nr:neutral zinc metallopeptidase [Neobacillus cucumis]
MYWAPAAQKRTNSYYVRYELQADYLAGVWDHYAQGKGYVTLS